MMKQMPQFDFKLVSIVAAASVAGVALIGVGSKLFFANRKEEDIPEYFQEDVKKIGGVLDASTRPSSAAPVESPVSVLSPISYSKSAVPKCEGDLLFFKILESYGTANVRETPELSSTSGSSTPAIPGVSSSASSGPKKKRRRNKSKNIVNIKDN
jgi:hypothetical protein